MAKEEESGQEPTEQPGERRLRQARERGQVPRSRELVIACQMLLVSVLLPLLITVVAQAAVRVAACAFTFDHVDATDESRMLARLAAMGESVVDVAMPLFFLVTVAGILGSVALGGFVFSLQVVRPRLERLSPGRGLGRLLSSQGLALSIRAALKTLLLLGVLVWLISRGLPAIVASAATDPWPAVLGLRTQLAAAVLFLTLAVCLVAALDVPWQLYTHHRRMLLTHQQVRERVREEEGAPTTRDRLRRIRRDIRRRSMIQDAARADFVLTNPGHIAVALAYNFETRSKYQSPVVMAKGADFLAEKIGEMARLAGKPVLCQPPLARALYYHVEVGQPVPEDLYAAMARVMAYVYLLNSYRAGLQPEPPVMQDVAVPDAWDRRRA